MRNTNEQVKEIMKRAKHLKQKRTLQKSIVSLSIAACGCIMLLVTTAFYLPASPSLNSSETTTLYGSLLLTTSYMGYVVVGLLSFLLGMCVMLLCIKFRNLKKQELEK